MSRLFRSVHAGTLVVAANLFVALWVAVLLLAGVAHAQAQVSFEAYTTDTENGVTQVGLATSDGRYAVTCLSGCDRLAAGQQVVVYPDAYVYPTLGLSLPDEASPSIVVFVDAQMDRTPCFQTDGECDVSLESADR